MANKCLNNIILKINVYLTVFLSVADNQENLFEGNLEMANISQNAMMHMT